MGEGRLDSSVANFANPDSIHEIPGIHAGRKYILHRQQHRFGGNLPFHHGDTIDFCEENLKDAQVQYGIQNGQAYQDTAAALQNQIASSEVGIKSAEMQLENYTLTSPYFRCYRTENVDEFGMVSAGNPVYVISNKDSLTVTFYVSEAVKNQLLPEKKSLWKEAERPLMRPLPR